MPLLLEALRKYKLPAAFACIGVWVEDDPGLHRRILREGHEILNHSYTHPYHESLNPHHQFKSLSSPEKEEEVARCHTVCEELLGYSPKGFRTPHFESTIQMIFMRFWESRTTGTLHSSISCKSPNGTFPFIHPSGVVEVPIGTCCRFPDAVFDTWNFLDCPRAICHSGKEFVTLFLESMKILVTQKGYMSYYFDPSALVRWNILDDALRILASFPDLRLISYGELAHLVRGDRKSP